MVIFQKEKHFIVRKWAMNFLTTTLPLRAYLFTFNVFVTAIIYEQNGFSVGSYPLKCSYFSWNKSLQLWKKNILTYLAFFDNRPELRNEIAWQRALRPRLYRENRYHSEKETRAAP